MTCHSDNPIAEAPAPHPLCDATIDTFWPEATTDEARQKIRDQFDALIAASKESGAPAPQADDEGWRSDHIQFTHLLDWLPQGFVNCQNGSEEWCSSYLNNAKDVIVALRNERDALKAKLTEVEAERDGLRERLNAKVDEIIDRLHAETTKKGGTNEL